MPKRTGILVAFAVMPWASSAAVSDGRLVLIGNEDGSLRAAIQPL